ncbi:hypothetical protein CC_2865 [Caulobacter vibrioides CB15]|uniref:Uncharacterized protein n=1 Tax=Caulobacter vibrioides (strain ATCC 19089 / CIP 103742 / CB 15) TaxID=190650 RepID=Q9A4G9_CAUVC|nr:hypothetical protein CC_2865 [Caulobacter vibrioides CB15]
MKAVLQKGSDHATRRSSVFRHRDLHRQLSGG